MNRIVLFILTLALVVSLGIKERSEPGFTNRRLGKFLLFVGAKESGKTFFLKAAESLKSHNLKSNDLANELKFLAWNRNFWSEEGDAVDSIALFKQATLICEEDTEEMAEIYMDLASFQHFNGDYQESEASCSEAYRIFGMLNNQEKQDEVIFMSVIHFVEQGMWSVAEEKLTELSNKYPSHSARLSVMGDLASSLAKDQDKALEYHLKACKCANGDIELVEAKRRLAAHYDRLGKKRPKTEK